MNGNRTMAGCEMMPRSAAGSSVSFDEGVDAAQAGLHRDIECVVPNRRRFARSLTHDAVEPDDFVQECLARALGKLQLWKVGTDLRAWLFRILHNEYVSQIRRAARQGTAVDWSEYASTLTCAPGQIEHLEIRDLVRAPTSLPEEQRTAVLMIGFGKRRLLRGRVGVQSPRRHHTISPFAWPQDPPRPNERGPFGAVRRQPLREGQLKGSPNIIV